MVAGFLHAEYSHRVGVLKYHGDALLVKALISHDRGLKHMYIYIYRTPSCIRISIKQYIYHLLITLRLHNVCDYYGNYEILGEEFS